MISPIKLTPQMDNATLVNAVNNTFQQIESENRSKTIKDEDGVNRILIGREPEGTYRIKISKESKDVLRVTDPNDLYFDSNQNTLRINKTYSGNSGTTNFAVSSTGWSAQLALTKQIPHGLNYIPDIRGYASIAGAGGYIPFPLSLVGKVPSGVLAGSPYWLNTYISATAANINIITTLMIYNATGVTNDGISLAAFDYKIQVLQETAS